MSEQLKPEAECPECGGPIKWIVVHQDVSGAPHYNGLCQKCNIIFRGREAPDITRGKALENNGEIDGVLVKDMTAMDKRITALPTDVQLGILRERHRRELEGAKP